MKEQLLEYLKDILKKSYGINVENLKLEIPPKKNMGDFSFACFLLAKDLKKSPIDIAIDISKLIEDDSKKPSEIEKIELMGGYLNIFLGSQSFSSAFSQMMSSDFYKNIDATLEETVYIDYIGANVGKPLHIGHMCTPSQGQVFINLFQKLGYNVISDSHIGDWGIIFGKLIVAFEKYGSDEALEENAVEHLFELYVKISTDASSDAALEQDFRDAFKKLSEGDTGMKNIWARFTRKSIEAMNLQLSRLFVKPDYNIGESFYEGLKLEKMENYPDLKYSMKEVVSELIEKGIATQNDDGSVGVEFPEELKIPSCILQKRDGTHGYLASDLASIKYRMDNWKPKKILYFVDVRQQLHLRQTFVISKLAGWYSEKNTNIVHAHNGFISLKDGAMSTRTGKIVKLELLLDEAEKRARDIIIEKRSDIEDEKLKELSRIIGIGAIKYGYLKKSRESDSVFDWDEFMSFDGNSGPYIQYAYVRAQRILKKSGKQISFENLQFNNEEEKNLVKHILGFSGVLVNMAESYYPHLLCQYVYDMTKKFSSFYNNIPILQESDLLLRDSRLALLLGFSKVLEESFEILGIELPNEM